ncbi:MAG: LemA family protein [Treponema sp.]|nr:LemA family protein [Treponema sp.]
MKFDGKKRKNKSIGFLFTIGFLLLLVLCFYLLFKSNYVKISEKENNVYQQWSSVQDEYYNRFDLLGELTSAAKKYVLSDDAFDSLSKTRAELSKQTKSARLIIRDEETYKNYCALQTNLEKNIQNILDLSKTNTALSKDKAFNEVRKNLEAIQHRINSNKEKLSDEVLEYNSYIQKFPQIIVAKMCKFNKITYIE